MLVVAHTGRRGFMHHGCGGGGLRAVRPRVPFGAFCTTQNLPIFSLLYGLRAAYPEPRH